MQRQYTSTKQMLEKNKRNENFDHTLLVCFWDTFEQILVQTECCNPLILVSLKEAIMMFLLDENYSNTLSKQKKVQVVAVMFFNPRLKKRTGG